MALSCEGPRDDFKTCFVDLIIKRVFFSLFSFGSFITYDELLIIRKTITRRSQSGPIAPCVRGRVNSPFNHLLPLSTIYFNPQNLSTDRVLLNHQPHTLTCCSSAHTNSPFLASHVTLDNYHTGHLKTG